jgi:asparagine synthase (glutamine-hydrolysing)
VPLLLLSGHVRAGGYKVVLTGEGADEVFGGYDLFKEAKVRRFCARSPLSASRKRLFERLYPWLKHPPTFTHAETEHLDRPWFGHLPRWTSTARTARFFSAAMRDSLGDWDAFRAIEATLPAGMSRWSPLARDQYIESQTLLAGYLLSSQGDRMAMAHSVEGRFPFLDHRVIEFANALPPRMKVRGLVEKYLLKRAARGLVPDAIRERPKQPYRAPDSQSFFENGAPVDYVAAMFDPQQLRDAGYFDPQASVRLFEKCRAGRAIGFADNMAFVAILSTMLVHHHFVLGRRNDRGQTTVVTIRNPSDVPHVDNSGLSPVVSPVVA